MSILALVVSVLAPAMSACRMAARNLKCATHLRTLAFDFRLFVDDFAERAAAEPPSPGASTFRIEDFQERAYRVDEYWDSPTATRAVYDGPNEVMMCPQGASKLERRAGMPCSRGAVTPRENVSIAFNMRLHRLGVRIANRPVWRPKFVSGQILNYPDVPLAFDVDGAAAVSSSQLPYYSAPPIASDDLFRSGEYWFPSDRHGGRTNVALVDGSVHSSHRPGTEPGFRWAYEPD